MALANVQGYLTSDGKFFFKDDKAAAEARQFAMHLNATERQLRAVHNAQRAMPTQRG